MSVLTITNIEKHSKDSILFPPFSFKMETGHIAAIHSNLNIRKAIIDMFRWKYILPNGEILINNESISNNKKKYIKQVGICYFEEGLYERLSVMDHLKFYKQIYSFNQTFDSILHITQLEEVKNKSIKNLTYSQRKRVQFTRLFFQDPYLYIFEEPDLNVDMETKRVFINMIQSIQQNGKSVLILTGNIESAMTMTDLVYRLNEKGIHPYMLEQDSTLENENVEGVEDDEREGETFQFNKIPTKVNDKIILFDPPEIDYIESNDGQSNVYIEGEAFPSMFTLNELEERLRHYGFFRCHRSYIVNLQKVREVITWTRNSYSLVLDDKPKSSIPLSKTKMVQLKEMLGLK